MRPYLGPPWIDSHPIWAVDVFHHAPPIHGIQNTEIQKKVFCDVIASVYSMLCAPVYSKKQVDSGFTVFISWINESFYTFTIPTYLFYLNYTNLSVAIMNKITDKDQSCLTLISNG